MIELKKAKGIIDTFLSKHSAGAIKLISAKIDHHLVGLIPLVKLIRDIHEGGVKHGRKLAEDDLARRERVLNIKVSQMMVLVQKTESLLQQIKHAE